MNYSYTTLLMLTTFFTLQSMDSTNITTDPKPCYLAYLPADVQNHIANYLTFQDRESDDEFVTRTRTAFPISPEHQLLLDQQNPDDTRNMLPEWFAAYIRRTHSIDGSRIITLTTFNKNPNVTILDTYNNTVQTHKKLMELSHHQILDIEKIALSRTGSHYAQLKIEKRPATVCEVIRYDYWLVIHNILSDEKQKFLIPWRYDNFISIGFNKQGTKVIIHAKKDYKKTKTPKKQKPQTRYHIVELTSPEEHSAKSQKTFATYGLCKDLNKNSSSS